MFHVGDGFELQQKPDDATPSRFRSCKHRGTPASVAEPPEGSASLGTL
jgi:hypothetical protein